MIPSLWDGGRRHFNKRKLVALGWKRLETCATPNWPNFVNGPLLSTSEANAACQTCWNWYEDKNTKQRQSIDEFAYECSPIDSQNFSPRPRCHHGSALVRIAARLGRRA